MRTVKFCLWLTKEIFEFQLVEDSLKAGKIREAYQKQAFFQDSDRNVGKNRIWREQCLCDDVCLLLLFEAEAPAVLITVLTRNRERERERESESEQEREISIRQQAFLSFYLSPSKSFNTLHRSAERFLFTVLV